MKMSEKWLSDRIAYINGLKNPSLTQKTLIELHNIPEHERTPTNTKHLNTLIKAERTAVEPHQPNEQPKKIYRRTSQKRKERTHKLVQLGALFEIANLDNHNPAELLGILLKTSELPQDDPKWALWREYGQQTLNQRKDTKSNKMP
jgi:hypothetical protein